MNFWDDVTPNSVANASDGFREFAIGDNEAFVKMAEEKVSESGNPMLVITFGNNDGAEIKHFIVDGEYKMQKLKQFYTAFDIPMGSSEIEDWRGKRGIVVCKQGKPYGSNNRVYNQVSYLKPIPKASGNPPPATKNTVNAPAKTDSRQRQADPFDDGFTDDIPF